MACAREDEVVPARIHRAWEGLATETAVELVGPTGATIRTVAFSGNLRALPLSHSLRQSPRPALAHGSTSQRGLAGAVQTADQKFMLLIPNVAWLPPKSQSYGRAAQMQQAH